MIIKNTSPKQFSLEGIIIESGEQKELDEVKGRTFLSLYEGTGMLEEILEEVKNVEVVPAEPVLEEVVETIIEPILAPVLEEPVGTPIEEVIEKLEPKVSKPRKKKV